MTCEICGTRTNFSSDVLGEAVPLCLVHAGDWEKLGPVAVMVAFALDRIDRGNRRRRDLEDERGD